MARDSELQQFGMQIDALIQRVEENANPNLRQDVQALIGSLMALHRKGLDAILGVIAREKDGGSLLETMVSEPFVEGLLLLHDLHPFDAEMRIRRTLERKSRELRIETELVEFRDGSARVRLMNRGSGCQGGAENLAKAVEAAILDAAPEIERVEIQQASEPGVSKTMLVQLETGISTMRP